MNGAQNAVAVQAAKGAPAVAGALFSAVTLNQWVALATLVYIIVQLLYLVRKWWREEVGGWRSQEEAKDV